MIIFYDSEIYKEKINTDILLIIEDTKEIRKINFQKKTDYLKKRTIFAPLKISIFHEERPTNF